MMERDLQMPDPDVEGATRALMRAAKRARLLAAQTRTELVIVRDGKLVREIPRVEEIEELYRELNQAQESL